MRKLCSGFVLTLMLFCMIDNAEAGKRCHRGQVENDGSQRYLLEGGLTGGRPWGEWHRPYNANNCNYSHYGYQPATAVRGRHLTTIPGVVADQH